jgi:hypothetical protein
VGHRKKRKRERKHEQSSQDRWRRQATVSEDDFIQPEPISLLEIGGFRGALGPQGERPKSCGSCRQFIEDHDLGRGTCLHIASGILNPFTDTPACEYFERARSQGRLSKLERQLS